MAQETLTVQASDRTGAEVGLQAVTTADGFKFLNTKGNVVLIITNDAGDLIVTATFQNTVDGQTVPAKSSTVAASETWTWGPFPTNWFNDTSDFVECTVDADLAAGIAAVSITF